MSKAREGATSARMAKRAAVGVVLAMVAAACTDTAVPTGVSPRAAVTARRDALAGDTARGQRLGITRLPRRPERGDCCSGTAPLGLMTPHSGSVLNSTVTYAIFLGTKWNTDAAFTGDKISSIQSFFAGFGGSLYANTVTEYGPTASSTFAGTIIDNSVALPAYPSTSYGGYLCTLLNNRGITPNASAFYAIYSTTPYPADSGVLAYHTNAFCGIRMLHFAVIFNMDSAGFVTDPYHYHSDDAAALVNATAHELVETITDANVGDGWYATNVGGEIADKCNFNFGPAPYNTLSNGSVFKLQGEWSNAAYQARSGYANDNGEPGCINSAPNPPVASISGPSQVWPGAACTYTANVTGGKAPFLYSWGVNGAWVTSSSISLTTSSDMYLQLRVKDAYGRISPSTSHYVHVYQYGMMCQY